MPIDTCITIQGNTVQEAVFKALKALNISEDQAEIEVLREEKHGILGMGSQTAKVKVSLKEETKAERELTDILIDLDLQSEIQETVMPAGGHILEAEDGIFDRYKLLYVTPGEVVALRASLQTGATGSLFIEEDFPAMIPADCRVIVKSGCELAKDGQQVISVISGRPVVEIAGNRVFISVDPIYEVEEVCQADGDVIFTGDVEVKGSITEGCRIVAHGNIIVHGDVTRANLKAGGSVIVHGKVLGSTIVAGTRGSLYSMLQPKLKEVRASLDNIYAVAQQLKSSPRFNNSDLKDKGDGCLIQLVLDSKFHNVPKIISEMARMTLSEGQSPHEEVADVISMLYGTLGGPGLENLQDIEVLRTMGDSIDLALDLMKSSVKREASIRAKCVQNSSLASSGSIVIEGEGSCFSSLSASGDIVVCGNPGIARGVKIASEGNITVKELGSEIDTQTSVQIKGNGKLTAGFIHPNVVLQIGAERRQIDRAIENFEAFANDNDLNPR